LAIQAANSTAQLKVALFMVSSFLCFLFVAFLIVAERPLLF